MKPVIVAVVLWIALMTCACSVEAQTGPIEPSDWGFTIQLGFVRNHLGDAGVKPGDAVIDEDGRVRVTRISNAEPMLLFGVHHVLGHVGTTGIGVGIVAAPGDNLIEGAGAGPVFVFGDAGKVSFTVGGGPYLRFRTTTLAPGWVDGGLAPGPNIQFLEKDELYVAFWLGAGF
jgi:hypothetical protein